MGVCTSASISSRLSISYVFSFASSTILRICPDMDSSIISVEDSYVKSWAAFGLLMMSCPMTRMPKAPSGACSCICSRVRSAIR